MMLLQILLILITAGCRTTKVENLVQDLPPKPSRQKIEPETPVKDILIYYESLVQSWELWAYTVEKMYYADSN